MRGGMRKGGQPSPTNGQVSTPPKAGNGYNRRGIQGLPSPVSSGWGSKGSHDRRGSGSSSGYRGGGSGSNSPSHSGYNSNFGYKGGKGQPRSPANAFVHGGWLYAPGMNRKQRRSILFCNQDSNEAIEGVERVWVGQHVPDGCVSDECVAAQLKFPPQDQPPAGSMTPTSTLAQPQQHSPTPQSILQPQNRQHQQQQQQQQHQHLQNDLPPPPPLAVCSTQLVNGTPQFTASPVRQQQQQQLPSPSNSPNQVQAPPGHSIIGHIARVNGGNQIVIVPTQQMPQQAMHVHHVQQPAPTPTSGASIASNGLTPSSTNSVNIISPGGMWDDSQVLNNANGHSDPWERPQQNSSLLHDFRHSPTVDDAPLLNLPPPSFEPELEDDSLTPLLASLQEISEAQETTSDPKVAAVGGRLPLAERRHQSKIDGFEVPKFLELGLFSS